MTHDPLPVTQADRDADADVAADPLTAELVERLANVLGCIRDLPLDRWQYNMVKEAEATLAKLEPKP